MSRHQIFAQKKIVLDSEALDLFGHDDSSFTFNSKQVLTTVADNISVGTGTLTNLTTGSDNVVIGDGSGSAYTSTESKNIVISNTGVIADQGTIRIGNTTDQTLCYIAGISGVTSAGAAAAVVNSSGKLGTVVSTRKRKREIEDISPQDFKKLYKMAPKKFKMIDDPSNEIHYGLIAEEVDELMPELVVHDEKGDPATVQYYKLDGLQLAALQDLSKQFQDQQQKLYSLEQSVAKLLQPQ